MDTFNRVIAGMMDRFDLIVIGVLGVVLLLIVSLYLPMTEEAITVTVIDKQYDDANEGIGVGVGVSSGGSVPVTAITSDDEDWVLIIELDDGAVDSFELPPEDYYRVEVGETIRVTKFCGTLSLVCDYRIEE